MDMLAVTWGQGLVTFLFVVICLLLILVILLQRGRGGGLAGAFGGAGGYSAFGAKTGDVFTWVTIVLTGMFVLVAIIGNWVMVPDQPMDETAVIAPVDGDTGAAPTTQPQ